MTAIQKFPKELLFKIFENLCIFDLNACQKVCANWYTPAHLMVLGETRLTSMTKIEKFTAFFDHNPTTEYFKAVKKIVVVNDHALRPALYRYDKAFIERLFARFPNLNGIVIYDYFTLINDFNDEICRSILTSCPYLDSFEVTNLVYIESRYSDVLYKIRYLLTSINLEKLNHSIPNHTEMINYLLAFPRLKLIYGESPHIRSFQQALPLLANLQRLKSLTLVLKTEEEHFIERYLETITEDEASVFLERLRALEILELSFSNDFSGSSIKFVRQYLTGLEFFSLRGSLSVEWTADRHQVFCNYVLGAVFAAKEKGLFSVSNLRLTDILSHLPHALHQVFEKALPRTRKNFRLNITNNSLQSRGFISLEIRTNPRPCLQEVDVTIKSDYGIFGSSGLFQVNGDHRKIIDMFELEIDKQGATDGFQARSDINMYIDILGMAVSAKEIILDIPVSYFDGGLEEGEPQSKNTTIQVMTLRGNRGLYAMELFEYFCSALPNLKQLNLYYFCGNWNCQSALFEVPLQRFSLEQLTIDITPAKNMMAKKMNKDSFCDDDFVVLEVNLTDNEERYVYKVTLDNLSVKCIKNKDLRGLSQTEDYLRIQVTVANTKHLEICAYKGVTKTDSEEVYLHGSRAGSCRYAKLI